MPRLSILLLVTLWPALLEAASATIAVASNFKTTLEALTTAFEQSHPHQLKVVNASTGVLYSQIIYGAPFDVLLAADSQRPRLLEQQDLAVSGSRFTYAIGQLVLIGPSLEQASPEQTSSKVLQNNSGKLAIANPAIAPYGLAAQQVLQHLDLWPGVESQLLKASNVAQAYQFVDSGGAALGLVAYSQLVNSPKTYRIIPASWHQPIEQQAVLLQAGLNNPAAVDFIAFLQSPDASTIIRRDGYTVSAQE